MRAEILPEIPFPVTVETLILGAGAAGLTAALAAAEAGQEVLVVERDAVPRGSTALSSGLIPAAGTRWQRAAGIADDPALFATDIQRKAGGQNDPALVQLLTEAAAPTLEWLADRFGLPFSLVENFDYPGHSRRRMHGLPGRSGAELIDALRAAAEGLSIDILTEARAVALHVAGKRICGATLVRSDGTFETVGCRRLILATSGFGANRALVAEHMPAIARALYFGHPGNEGEAILWGKALGAELKHLGAYQGHGNVAHPHGILITWAVIMEGGCQLDLTGRRFWDESQGYSEAARAVLARPGGVAITVFDERIAQIARQFPDFRAAEAQGAVRRFESFAALARGMGLPEAECVASLQAFEAAKRGERTDPFGRRLAGLPPLSPPFCAVRVTGALFHTQGGLAVDAAARVRRAAGGVFPNLFAAGGAASGVSGAGDFGYLSGNGLLSAVVLGRVAGAASAMV